MNVNTQIKNIIRHSKNVDSFCESLRELSDIQNSKCPAARLLLDIRHYSIVNENINSVDILEHPDGAFKLIRDSLTDTEQRYYSSRSYNIYNLTFNH